MEKSPEGRTVNIHSILRISLIARIEPLATSARGRLALGDTDRGKRYQGYNDRPPEIPSAVFYRDQEIPVRDNDRIKPRVFVFPMVMPERYRKDTPMKYTTKPEKSRRHSRREYRP